MSYLGVLHHDASHRLFIAVLCLFGAASILLSAAYADPVNLYSEFELGEGGIEALGASGVNLLFENTQVTQQSTVAATLYGYPHSDYYVWFLDTNKMTGEYGDQPPQFSQKQDAISHDSQNGPYTIGSYVYSQGGGASIQENVASSLSHGVLYYALVRTGSNGQAPITFVMSSGTKPGLYTVRAERFTQGQYEIAHAPIEVLERKGGMTLTTERKTVLPGDDIVLTFTGQPLKYYTIWVINTGSMSGEPEDQPPLLISDQVNVWRDPASGPYEIGQYHCDTCRGLALQQSVSQHPDAGTRYYSRVMTDTQGFGTVTFSSTTLTKPQEYTFRIEEPFAAVANSAEVTIQIQSNQSPTSSLTLTPQSEHITLGSSSYIVLTGLPNTEYYLWFQNTDYMSGYPGDQPPTFQENQKQFLQDPADGPYIFGKYAYADACCGRVIQNDVPSRPDSGVGYYGLVKTDEIGRAVIGFDTEYMVTKPGNYLIHGERSTDYGYQKVTAVITVGSNIPPGTVPTPWPTSTQTPTWTPVPTQAPVPTPTYTLPGKLVLATDTRVLDPGEAVTVTLSGQPLTEYYFWVSDTAHLSGLYGDQPLVIPSEQRGIYQDTAQNIIIGKHPIVGKDGMTIHDDVPLYPYNGTCYYALVTTDRVGVAQIRLQAPQGASQQQYTLRAERTDSLTYPEFATTSVTVAGAPTPGLTLTVQPGASSLGTVFQAHVSGMPLTAYYLWLSGTSGMSGLPGDQPPLIPLQPGIVQDETARPVFIGDYRYLGGDGKGIRDDVPIQPELGVRYYAQVITDEQGQAFFSLATSSDTKPEEYTLTVELPLIRNAGEEGSAESTTFEIERVHSRTASAQFSVHPTVQDHFSLQLLPGWNFISVPGVPTPGSDTFAVFSGVDTQGRSIWAYDPGKWPDTQGWNMGTVDDKIEPLDGYWIYSASPMTILFPLSDSTLMSTELSISGYAKEMYPGWNAVGLGGQHSRSAKDALFSVHNDWTISLGYNNALQRYDTSIIHGGTDDYADNRLMQPGAGYWIYMQNQGTLLG